MSTITTATPQSNGAGATAVSLNGESCAVRGEAIKNASAILVSCVKNARDTKTHDYDANEIAESIRTDKQFELRPLKLAPKIEHIRKAFADVLVKTGDRKAAKNAVNQEKKQLPAVMWSGRFSKRKGSDLLEHSGLLCADLDELGERVAEVRTKLKKSPHLRMMFSSPTGDGLKCVFRVPADAERHQASFRAIEQHVHELSDVHIDESGSDVARLCFLSYDPGLYLNEDAVELPPLVDDKTGAKAAIAPVCVAKNEARRCIASEVLGDIDWKTDTSGYCTCPDQQSHTTEDGERDCEVFLANVPTIYCFHDHCREAIKATSRKLRSLISQAERHGVLTLPDPIDAMQLLGAELPPPPELVLGILHQGSKMVIGGGSKSFKTWALIDLAVSIATGIPWWGFNTNKGRVLYMNFEIQDPFFKQRLADVCIAKDCHLAEGELSYFGLRGKAADLRTLMPEIIAKLKDGGYSLIVFDPIYKGLGGRDENKAGDIASLLNEIESLAVETGAAVAFGHHFSKGNQANKDSIDRIGGSGVFARDPDTILTMTKHKEDDAFVVEAVLRNFPPVDPFVVRRAHPLMVRDEKLDPKDLKKAGASQQKYSDEDILEPLKYDGKTTTQWRRELQRGIRISESCFHIRLRDLRERDLIKKQGKKWVKATI
jgi:hypothetical protein